MNHGSRGYSRGRGEEPRSRGGGGPRGRGGGGSSIGGMSSGISAAINGTTRIVLLILLSELYMTVGVLSVILSWSDTRTCVGIGKVSNLALLNKPFIKLYTNTSVVLLTIFTCT